MYVRCSGFPCSNSLLEPLRSPALVTLDLEMLSRKKLVLVNPPPAGGQRGEEPPGLDCMCYNTWLRDISRQKGGTLGFLSGSWFCSAALCCEVPACIPAGLYPFLSWPQRGHGSCEPSGPHTTEHRRLEGAVSGGRGGSLFPPPSFIEEENLLARSRPETVYISLAKQTLLTGGQKVYVVG